MNGGLFGEMAVHVGDERLDGLRRRGPGCYQANGGMFGIHFGPDIKCVVLLQLFNQPMREDGENLVGGGLRKKREPGVLDGLPQQSRHVVCMLGQLEIQIILKQLTELQS